MIPQWSKDPDEELDFTVNWLPDLGDDDTIVTSTWLTPTPAGLVVGSGAKAPSNTPNTTLIWLSGGTDGTDYHLTNRVTTAGGRTYDKDVTLRVASITSALPGFNGCVWPIDPACLTEQWATYDISTRQRAVSLASATLTRLTAGRVGDCPVRLRPDPQRGVCGLGWPGVHGWGVFHTYAGFGFAGWAGRRDPRELELPAPIYSVDEVLIDGDVIDPADYRVHNQKLLVYVGEDLDGWPATNDFTKDSTEVGTFEVTYHNMAPVDAQGSYAAGLLAVEFAKACSGTTGTGSGKCKFPSNITSIVRQGIAIEFIAGAFPGGMTGVREVDNYTAGWNRGGRQPATLIDVGAPDHRIVTG